MGYIKGAVFFGLVILVLVWLIVNEIRCKYYLEKLIARYKDGIDIGCANLEELRENLMTILGQDVIIMDNYVLAREGNKKYIFFLENGRVIAEYPADKMGHSKASRGINSFLRMFKLKKAMAISRLMDRIAEKYSFGFKTEEPRTYVKARGVIKGMVISYIVGAIVTIAIIAWAFLLNSSKMIDEVKNYSPEGYAKCTFGKAFEDFFSDENWRFFKADKNTNVVEFTGKANLNSKKVEVLVQFTLDELGHNPRVHYIEVDGKKAEDYIVDSMFDEIFKDCGDKRSVVKNKKESSDINHPKDKQIKAENNKKPEKKKKKTATETTRYKYREDELIDAAIKYYCAVKGVNHISAMVDGGDRDDIMIRLFEDGTDMISTSDWYTVNVYTGQGTDFNGNYIDIMNPPETSANSYTDDEYIFPNSDSTYLTDYDLQGMTSEECRLARNEIYARHGRMFKDKALQNYFDSKSWYIPSVRPEDFNEHWLNEYEKANAKLIKSFE